MAIMPGGEMERDADFADALGGATNGGSALGDARFKRPIANAPGRRIAPLPKRRLPRRKPDRRQFKPRPPISIHGYTAWSIGRDCCC